MYIELVAIILGVSLLLYTILGGADFGAGIVELFIGDRSIKTITKAIAPVWEANHMWFIIAVVIMFNGFPKAYSTLSTALHIPIMLVLLGIIMRGAAFTFRHYDAYKDESQKIYSLIFRFSSIFTVLFLGITFGALFGGTIPPQIGDSFMDYYIHPWFNLFCLSIGIFLTILSTYIATIFLLGEVETEEGYNLLAIFTRRLFVASLISGTGIFLISYLKGLSFHSRFLNQPLSIIMGVAATLAVPFIFKMIREKKTWRLRILAGAQILFIISGWFVIQWPDLMLFSNGTSFTIYNTAAPTPTMKVLLYALIFGICTIFPSLFYLFKIFKIKKDLPSE